jgi:hypothetical protein
MELIPTMKKIKAGPVEAEFELATKHLLAEASKASAINEPLTVAQESLQEEKKNNIVTELLKARTDPAGMIIEGWTKVDGELHKFGRQMDIIHDPLENTAKVYDKMVGAGGLPRETVELVRDLRELRNKVAHALVTPTVDAAQSYLVAVDRVVELIRNFRKNLPNYGPDNR